MPETPASGILLLQEKVKNRSEGLMQFHFESIKQSRHKSIEKFLARRESQREFLKFQQDLKLILSERCRRTWAKDKEKVIYLTL